MPVYELIRRKRKTVTLTVINGKLYVYAPLSLSKKFIEDFIELKAKWIGHKIKLQSDKKIKFSALLSYENLQILGAEHKIIFSADKKKIAAEENFLFVPEKYFFDVPNAQNIKLTSAVALWMRKNAVLYIKNRLEFHAERLGITFSGFALTNAKTKWGSCDSKNKILLNWRLLMLDQNLIDYVIIHELCHTFEHNHSKNFWNIVEKFMPEYKDVRKKLKECSILNELFR